MVACPARGYILPECDYAGLAHVPGQPYTSRFLQGHCYASQIGACMPGLLQLDRRQQYSPVPCYSAPYSYDVLCLGQWCKARKHHLLCMHGWHHSARSQMLTREASPSLRDRCHIHHLHSRIWQAPEGLCLSVTACHAVGNCTAASLPFLPC